MFYIVSQVRQRAGEAVFKSLENLEEGTRCHSESNRTDTGTCASEDMFFSKKVGHVRISHYVGGISSDAMEQDNGLKGITTANAKG